MCASSAVVVWLRADPRARRESRSVPVAGRSWATGTPDADRAADRAAGRCVRRVRRHSSRHRGRPRTSRRCRPRESRMRRVMVAFERPTTSRRCRQLGGLEASRVVPRRVVVTQAGSAEHYASSLGPDPWIASWADGETPEPHDRSKPFCRRSPRWAAALDGRRLGGGVGDTAGFARGRSTGVSTPAGAEISSTGRSRIGQTAVNSPRGKRTSSARSISRSRDRRTDTPRRCREPSPQRSRRVANTR